MRWTTGDIGYLERHAREGAAAVAHALGRSRASVVCQAHRYGISLRRSWQCPRCGRVTYRPLSQDTGWCSCCTKEKRVGEIAEQVREMEREVMRERDMNRERQRLYSRKSRAKSSLKSMKEK